MNTKFKKIIPLMPKSREIDQCARSLISNTLGESWKWDKKEEFEESIALLAAFIVRAINHYELMVSLLKEVYSEKGASGHVKGKIEKAFNSMGEVL